MAAIPASNGAPPKSLLVFGDSLADVGNAFALRGAAAFPCPPHWRGRRCDGPVWVEHLAALLALPPLRHSLAGGSDHAFGGARSGPGLSAKGMPNLLAQVEGYLTAPAPPPADADAAWGDPSPRSNGGAAALEPGTSLVVLRAGANDYLDAAPSVAVAERINRHLLDAVAALADAGHHCFLVPSELPWGFSPIQLPGVGEAERRGLNRLIAGQNASLRAALSTLAAERGLLMAQPDFHELFLAVRGDPAGHGFSEIERPVLLSAADPGGPWPGSAGAAPSPADEEGGTASGDGHLWWDNWAHLTSAFHRLLAQEGLRAWSEAQARRRPGPAADGAVAGLRER